MPSSKTSLVIVLVAFLLSCVWLSNAREVMKRQGDVECVNKACPPVIEHVEQYFGTCFKDKDCKNSCFDSCKIKKCSSKHLCICEQC
ncbi:unnamed protein product [Cochlearia groenlandica]